MIKPEKNRQNPMDKATNLMEQLIQLEALFFFV